jgi:hypothetical protein
MATGMGLPRVDGTKVEGKARKRGEIVETMRNVHGY